MVQASGWQQFKMAAIDLDGTLLSHDTQINPANRLAVQRLQNAGVQVVLASGRHYLNMRRYAEALPGVEWLIACQGGEVCKVDRSAVLTTEFLAVARVEETLALGASLGLTVVAYAEDEIITDSGWNDDLDFYSTLAGYRPRHCPNAEFLDRPIFKLLWAGESRAIERTAQPGVVSTANLQMVRTHARLLEFMPLGISKASGLKVLAERLGLTATEILAFGDGDNDVPMFEWAGVSVAMAHGWPDALRKATYTSPAGPADTALARAVDLVFEKAAVEATQEN